MDPAVDHGRLALDLSAEYEDEVGLAWSHRVFGIVLERQGRVAEVQDIGARYKEAETWTNLGDAHESAGHANAARTAWRQALEILTELGHREVDVVRARLRSLDPDAGPSEPSLEESRMKLSGA